MTGSLPASYTNAANSMFNSRQRYNIRPCSTVRVYIICTSIPFIPIHTLASAVGFIKVSGISCSVLGLGLVVLWVGLDLTSHYTLLLATLCRRFYK